MSQISRNSIADNFCLSKTCCPKSCCPKTCCSNSCGCAKHSFVITTPAKQNHPWEHHITETEDAMAVDGVKGATLYLKRGCTYCFIFNQTEQDQPFEHLLFFTSDPTGGKQGGKFSGDFDPINYDPPRLPGTPKPYGKGTRSFTITCDFPDVFYYQCKNHQFMGGLIIVTC